MQVFLNNIVSSYETSVRNMGAILDTNHNILEGFQDSFLDRKQEWEKLNAELRKILAKNESLRCKDFDNMMQAIFSPQYEEEREVRNLISSCLNEQKEAVNTLRDNFIRVKDAIVTGETERVKEFNIQHRERIAQQIERRDEVHNILDRFRKERSKKEE